VKNFTKKENELSEKYELEYKNAREQREQIRALRSIVRLLKGVVEEACPDAMPEAIAKYSLEELQANEDMSRLAE